MWTSLGHFNSGSNILWQIFIKLFDLLYFSYFLDFFFSLFIQYLQGSSDYALCSMGQTCLQAVLVYLQTKIFFFF